MFHGVSLTPFAHVFQQVTNPPVSCHRYIVCTHHRVSGSLPSFLLSSFVFGQSRRMPLYHAAWRRLVQLRLIYPSPHSRKGHSNSSSHFITTIQILFLSPLNRNLQLLHPDHPLTYPTYLLLDVARALSAPHEGEEEGEPLFPPSLRPLYMQQPPPQQLSEQQQLPEPSVGNDSHTDHSNNHSNSNGSSSFRCGDFPAELLALSQPNHVNWRFRVPDKEEEEEDISFVDGHMGPQSFRPGESRPDALSHLPTSRPLSFS